MKVSMALAILMASASVAMAQLERGPVEGVVIEEPGASDTSKAVAQSAARVVEPVALPEADPSLLPPVGRPDVSASDPAAQRPE